MKKDNNQKIIAIIPARGGSKGLANKNICLLNKKPLIAYTIEVALQSTKINKVVVSTDNRSIAKIAEKYGAQVPFFRPQRLAQDTTPMSDVIQHTVKSLEKKGEKYDYILILQPTSPLRRLIDINKAINKIITLKTDSVISVCQTEYSPYWMKVINNDRIFPLIKGEEYTRRQDLPPVYRLNGAIYLIKRENLMTKNIFGNICRPLIMAVENSIDIDTIDDLHKAELILKRKQK